MSPVQRGIPLDDTTLSSMSPSERFFWISFMEEAREVLEKCIERGDARPYTPTDSLKTKYNTALTQYEGGKYCQMIQLHGLFSFG